jgi:hypothetical protein
MNKAGQPASCSRIYSQIQEESFLSFALAKAKWYQPKTNSNHLAKPHRGNLPTVESDDTGDEGTGKDPLPN